MNINELKIPSAIETFNKIADRCTGLTEALALVKEKITELSDNNQMNVDIPIEGVNNFALQQCLMSILKYLGYDVCVSYTDKDTAFTLSISWMDVDLRGNIYE